MPPVTSPATSSTWIPTSAATPSLKTGGRGAPARALCLPRRGVRPRQQGGGEQAFTRGAAACPQERRRRLPGSTGGLRPAESLAYFEVARYWVEQYGIDGWRLDQAYQLGLDDWRAIRSEVAQASAAPRTAGQQWGTLGYMVGKCGRAPTDPRPGLWPERQPGRSLRRSTSPALRPGTGAGGGRVRQGRAGASVLDASWNKVENYPDHAMPNLMLGNHDLVRFGDLLEQGNFNGADYWQRLGRPSASWPPLRSHYLLLWRGVWRQGAWLCQSGGGDCAAQGSAMITWPQRWQGPRCHRLRAEQRAGRAQAVAERSAGPARRPPAPIRGQVKLVAEGASMATSSRRRASK